VARGGREEETATGQIQYGFGSGLGIARPYPAGVEIVEFYCLNIVAGRYLVEKKSHFLCLLGVIGANIGQQLLDRRAKKQVGGRSLPADRGCFFRLEGLFVEGQEIVLIS